MWRKSLVLIVIAVGGSHVTFAHPGQPIEPHDLWSAWNDDFFLLLVFELSLLAYVCGIWRLWLRAGIGHGIAVWRVTAFIAGIGALVVALISPLDALSGALFSAHMTQHLVLVMVAAPLLAISDIPLALMWGLPRRFAHNIGRDWNQLTIARRGWHFLTKPLAAWMLFAAALWLWHMPIFYEAALRDEFIHALEHISFLLTAMLFWWVLVDTSKTKHSHYGFAVLYLFTTALHSGILGALLTFATRSWYPSYAPSVTAWGLTLIEDQQLAGLIMWIPGGAVFALLAILYFRAWLSALEQRTAKLQA